MRRLILFAHYDVGNRIRPYILHHLQALGALGGEVWFISNAPLPGEEVARIKSLSKRVILRENLGYDFGMWQEAIRQVDLSVYDEVLLTNSSIAGPFWPLDLLFDRMADQPCDFWGLTENNRPSPHLQSFFLVFRKTALQAPIFGKFWDSILPYRDKVGVIYAYELGLSILLRGYGLMGIPAFPTNSLKHSLLGNILMRRKWRMGIRSSQNPSIYFPDLLIRAGMPYVKLEALESNPGRLCLPRLLRAVTSTGYDLSGIR